MVSGGGHPDLNPAVLLPGATADDAAAPTGCTRRGGVPGLISLSDLAEPGAAEALRAGGYVAAPLPEALMRCTARPDRVEGAFRVARVRNRGELDVAIAVAAESARRGHSVSPADARP